MMSYASPAHRGDVAGSMAGNFDIKRALNIENALDLEGKNSDIYHVINCISHFFWIMYIICYGKLLIDVDLSYLFM